MRIAVTGTSGQIARALADIGPAAGADITLLGRDVVDLADCAGCERRLAVFRPDLIVSAGAYTAVDKAESEPDLAFAVNAAGAGHVAAAAAALGIPVIHLSTDYVFDGAATLPYVESDAPNPTSVYGRTKLEGERLVQAANPHHVILRTAWVYSATGKNFVRTMLSLAETRDEVRVVSDQFGSPTYAEDIARAILAIARALTTTPAIGDGFGVFHFAGSGDTSWAGFAAAIFALSARLGRASARVVPIATADYPTPARRPANSRLACGRLAAVYGISAPFWAASLDLCLARLFAAAPMTTRSLKP